MNSNLILLKKVKCFALLLDKYLENIPKDDYYYKQEIRSVIKDIIKNVVIVNTAKNFEDIKIFALTIEGDISLLNYYLELIMDKKYISERNLKKLTRYIVEISKINYAWLEKKSECKL